VFSDKERSGKSWHGNVMTRL